MKYLFSFFLIAIAFPSFAQTKVRYTYDNAGNRVKRDLAPMFTGGGDDRNDGSEQPESQALSPEQINVFPNPTLDWLNISLNQPSDAPLNVELFDPSGRLVRQSQLSGDMLSIDVSDQPSGYYMLFVRAGASYLTWKVSIVK